ncbi:MAG: hypothetical protein GC159_19385 [Phycisphaera sp.]|nr:hypothetical protein [Phycisphaera sp.]
MPKDGPPSIDARRIVSVEVRMYDPLTSGVVRRSSTDRAVIETLATLLSHAEPVEDHRCVAMSRITFIGPGDRRTAIALLPGHEAAYYQLARRGFYRFPRRPFVDRMIAMGYEPAQIDLGYPDAPADASTPPATPR